MYILAQLVRANPVPAYIYYCTESKTRSSVRRSILGALTQGLVMSDLTFSKAGNPIHVTNPEFSVPLVNSSKPIRPENYPELFI